LLNATNIHKCFGELEVLKGIDLSLKRGEVVCLIGASGSGKSTFLRCLNFLEIPTSGTVTFDGKAIDPQKTDLNSVRAKMGMVFQHFNLFPHMNVKANITTAMKLVKKLSKDECHQKAKELLDQDR